MECKKYWRLIQPKFIRGLQCKTSWRLLLLGCLVPVTLYTINCYISPTAEDGKTKWISHKRELSTNQTQYLQKGEPVNHIAFIKVPKAASTTVQNIFLRYGYENDLEFALPKLRPAGGDSLTARYFYAPLNKKFFDITCTHIRYDKEQFHRVLPDDTAYIGTVREPFSRFRSFVRFIRPKSVLDIPGNDPVLKYLSREKEFRTRTGEHIINCNGMAWYFGFPYELYLTRNHHLIDDYLLQLDKEFDIILVMEFLDESIVLMRRILNWDLRHVLYAKLRVNKLEDTRLVFGTTEETLYKRCGYLDYRLYDYFLNKLKEKIKRQLPDFNDEVAYFRKTRAKYDDFCLSSLSEDLKNAVMTFEGSPWNAPFVITSEDCKKLYIHDVEFLQKIQEKQFSSY
ncbi:galactose-3-O-sulfotransferase 2-like [Ylistrum balloti]|uniref:galactose-3-O-sulfotransferase 2-like n=1 Tax=Ylistrum balloti TaxID=509963 RepID=UPI0029059799|nr:galactose-3-O-sulfotransferase 2-like [Ylistrum balloti]